MTAETGTYRWMAPEVSFLNDPFVSLQINSRLLEFLALFLKSRILLFMYFLIVLILLDTC